MEGVVAGSLYQGNNVTQIMAVNDEQIIDDTLLNVCKPTGVLHIGVCARC